MYEIKYKVVLGSKPALKIITTTTGTIAHPCLDIFVVKDVLYIPRGVCNRNQSREDLQRHPIFLTDFIMIMFLTKN